MEKKFEWVIPMKIISEANTHEHWTKSSKRHKMQQFLVRCEFRHHEMKVQLPCNIKLTRLSARFLDSDNLQIAFKWIRDQIADCILPGLAKGRADDDKRISWQYCQEAADSQGIKIEGYW